jgi:signal transduction histidine kinase
MKLSAHYNKASIIITVLVLLAGAVIYFFAINYIARNQLDRDLTEEFEEVIDYVNLNGKLPRQVEFDEDQTVFIKTDQKNLQTRFFDTVYNDNKEKKNEPGRAVSGLISLKGLHYKVIITESRESTEYLVQIIAIITLLLMIGLILILFITNKYILNGLWKPFYETLTALKAFNISDSKSFRLKSNKVDEFNELNSAVEIMSLRVKNDYQHLKHFTENASHEMMTPLAVITSKLDTLIQDETLKPEQYEQINDIYAATGKLSRMNQSLLLLVKIENNLIDDAEILSLNVLMSHKIRQFQELILTKDIQVIEALEEKKVLVSKYLIDILLNNLFSNAIRHNVNHGKLIIKLTGTQLIFQNTGDTGPLDPQRLFERFQKEQKSEGTGLGLTIVKNICTVYKWEITYYYDGLLHTFQIRF